MRKTVKFGITGIKDPEAKTCEDDLVDETLSDSAKQDLQSWQRHDDSTKDFCDIHTETCVECDFIDLTINPGWETISKYVIMKTRIFK